MKMNIAIVDDLKADRDRLLDLLKRLQGLADVSTGTVRCFSSGEELIGQFVPREYQLVFMDICMDRLNGIETAARLRGQDAALLIVFLTTSREYAFDAFPLHPFDYLVKPIEQERLSAVLDEAARLLGDEERVIAVRVGRAQRAVPVRSITAAVSRGHCVELCLSDGSTLNIASSFGEIEGLLRDEKGFVLCNRGLIVGMDHVLSVTDGAFRMKNGQIWPIRVRGRAAVVDAFAQYQILRLRGAFRRMGEK